MDSWRRELKTDRLEALEKQKKLMRPDYLFVEWAGDDEYKEHSVIPGKVTEPEDGGYVRGAKVKCRLKQGTYFATVIAAGSRTECLAAQTRLEKETAFSDDEPLEDESTQGGNKEKKIQEPSEGSLTANRSYKGMGETLDKEKEVTVDKEEGETGDKEKETSDKAEGETGEKDKEEGGTGDEEMGETGDKEKGETSDKVKDETGDKENGQATHKEKGDKGEKTRLGQAQQLQRLQQGKGYKSGRTQTRAPKSQKKLSAKAKVTANSEMDRSLLDEILKGPISCSSPVKTCEGGNKSGDSDQVYMEIENEGLEAEDVAGHSVEVEQRPTDVDNDTQEICVKSPQSIPTPPPTMGYHHPLPPHFYSPYYMEPAPKRPRSEDESVSSLSHYSTDSAGIMGLRDLVLGSSAQTQAAIANLNVSVQTMMSEISVLKEQMRPLLKKRKSDDHKEREKCEEQKDREKDHRDRDNKSAIFGAPSGGARQRVELEQFRQSDVDAVERRCGNTPEKLALGLLLLLFTADELRQGNCTKPVRKDIQELDSKRLWAIRCHVDYLHPAPDGEASSRWGAILTKTLNPKCRQMRAK